MKNRMLNFTLFISLFLFSCQGYDRTEIPADEIRELIEGFNGIAGVYVKDLITGTIVEVNADTVFPTASMIKVPIMVKIFDRVDKEELGLQDDFEYGPDPSYEYSGDIISDIKPGSEVKLAELVHLMMSASNNTASLWNQYLAGTGTAINDYMAELGFEHTRVNSRTDGRGENFSQYGWGQTSPREMATLVEQIFKGEIVSKHASEQMFRIMSRNYWDQEALSVIPPTVNVASKNGSVSRSKSEVLLVNAPSGDYVFCVITKNQEDIRREYDNEGWVLIRQISGILYSHFEPDSNWQPNVDRNNYW